MEGGEDDEEEGLYLRLTEETARSIKLNQRNEAAGQRGGDEQGRAGTLLSYLEPIQQGETAILSPFSKGKRYNSLGPHTYHKSSTNER